RELGSNRMGQVSRNCRRRGSRLIAFSVIRTSRNAIARVACATSGVGAARGVRNGVSGTGVPKRSLGARAGGVVIPSPPSPLPRDGGEGRRQMRRLKPASTSLRRHHPAGGAGVATSAGGAGGADSTGGGGSAGAAGSGGDC